MFDVTPGERLKAARVLAGISGKELDRLADLKPGHVWVIERSEGGTEAGTLNKAAEVLGLSLDYVVRGEGRPPSAKALKAAVERARERYRARLSSEPDSRASAPSKGAA